MSDEPISRDDALGSFLRLADRIQEAHESRTRPAYAETCPCGGRVEVSNAVPAAERRRIHQHFAFHHRECTAQPLAPVLGSVEWIQPEGAETPEVPS